MLTCSVIPVQLLFSRHRYIKTDIFLLFFNVDSRSNLRQCVEQWAPEVTHCCPDVPIVLVGTKEDMRHRKPRPLRPGYAGNRLITYEEGVTTASQIGAAAYVETSSLSGYNIRRLLATYIRIARVHEHFLPNPQKGQYRQPRSDFGLATPDVRAKVEQIRAKWKIGALATQHGTDRLVAGVYLLMDGTGATMPHARSATDFNVALLVGRQHYRRVDPKTGVGFAPAHRDFCAIAPINADPISQTCTWGWFVASDDSTLAAPTFIARVKGEQGDAPLSEWTALKGHNYCSPAPPPFTSNRLAATPSPKERAINIALGLGAYTDREIAKQRTSNKAAGRGAFADNELLFSATIAAAPVQLVLRTMAGDELQLDWAGPWRVSATAPFAIDVRALAVKQHSAALGHCPEEFDLFQIKDGQDNGSGGRGARGGGGADGGKAEAASDNSFTTIDLDAADTILKLAAGRELAYLVTMRHQVLVTLSIRKQANDGEQASDAGSVGNADALRPAPKADVTAAVNLVVNHAEASVGYVRRKVVAHLHLDATLFTVKIQRDATEKGLWDDAAEMSYSAGSQEPRHLIVTPVLLSDRSVPSHWRRKMNGSTEKGCAIT